MSGPASTIFLIDDDPSVRKAFARLLQAAGLNVSVHASAQEYLECYDPDLPGCLVLDLAMPQISGLDLQRELVARGGAPPIVFLTGHGSIPETVQAMKHGAVEFLTKPVDEQVLIAAVHSAVEKDRIDRTVRADLANVRKRLATLSPREAQVLRCVVAGMLNKQTAAKLGTVEKTIKVHRSRVMEKMQVRSVAELVTLAAQAGITSSSES